MVLLLVIFATLAIYFCFIAARTFYLDIVGPWDNSPPGKAKWEITTIAFKSTSVFFCIPSCVLVALLKLIGSTFFSSFEQSKSDRRKKVFRTTISGPLLGVPLASWSIFDLRESLQQILKSPLLAFHSLVLKYGPVVRVSLGGQTTILLGSECTNPMQPSKTYGSE